MNRTDTLDAARALVAGERQDEYGSPLTNFSLTARLWGSYLGTEVSASDVACLMVLLKVARLRSGPGHVDSWVDVAGYGALGAEVSG